MLDDRTIKADPLVAPFLVWLDVDNETGWNAYLGALRGTTGVPPTAAAARLQNHSGLPPLYMEVGELDLFRDEDITYAADFRHAGVSAELHVLPGAPHGFEWFAPDSKIGSSALAGRLRAIELIGAQ